MEIAFLTPLIIQFFQNWWWFFLPVILFKPAKFLYIYWVTWEVWYKKHKFILLEIKPPAEVLKPFKAMEDVIHTLWGVYDGPNWREMRYEGMPPKAAFWFSLEIASFGGDIHFYIRIKEDWQKYFESAIYSYYPAAEISVVEDYTQKVPKNIPNKDWEIYGEDFTLLKGEDIYPIRTYSSFFEETPNVAEEEKRIDPMDSLLEQLSKLKSGEQFWMQIVCAPIQDKDVSWQWITRGKAVANKLAKRPEEKKQKSMLRDMTDIVLTGKVGEEEEEPTTLVAPELRLTPGEKDILKGVETKISKQGFKTWIRIVHLYRVNEPYFAGTFKIGRGYLLHFATENLNTIVFFGPTRSKIHYWLRNRRLFLRKRKQFINYINRWPSYFPWNLEGKPVHPLPTYPLGPGKWGKCTFVLNAEELATIYHFPSKIQVPTVPRVEAKKGGPPASLPVE